MKKSYCRFVLSLHLLIAFVTNGVSQLGSDGSMDGITLQRTGVYNAKGPTTISGIDWKTNKFFDVNYENNFFTNSKGEPEIASLGFSDPIISGDILYYRLYPTPQKNYIVAMNASSGEVLWTFRSKEQLSNPAVSGDRIYFASEDNFVYELNSKTGAQNWKLAEKKKRWNVFSHSPLINKGNLYVSTQSGELIAIDIKTQKIVWSFQAKGFLSPTVYADETIFIGDEKGNLNALDSMGKPIWTLKTSGQIRSVTHSEKRVFFRTDKGLVGCVDASSGALQWSLNLGGEYKPQFPLSSLQIGSTLAIDKGTLTFAGEEKNKYFVFGVSSLDGRLKWKVKIDEPTRNPVISSGIVYYGSWGKLIAIDLSEGKLLWEFAQKNDGRKNVVSSPAISTHRFHVISDQGVVFSYK